MKKILFMVVFTLACVTPAVFGADVPDRTAMLIDNAGMEWDITGVFVHTEPGGFYKSRFCLTVLTDTFQVAIPPENLISVEVNGENCTVIYQWMGQRQIISGKVASKAIGGQSDVGFIRREFNNLKKLKFKEEPAVVNWGKPPSYEVTLVLTDGTRVPVANLIRISSQSYSAVPLSGVEEVTVFELNNDVGFFREENAPTIKFEDIKSMEFPTEDTIVLTLKRVTSDTGNEGKSKTGKKAKTGTDQEAEIDEDYEFLKEALDDFEIDFGKDKTDAGQPFPKNWAYGFTGIYRKGYFFILAKHVKSIEFGVEQQ